jgi:RNA polymerase sigma-70 factor (ECF subfamily)
MPWAYTIARRLFLDAIRARRSAAASPHGQVRAADPHEVSRLETEIASSDPSAEDLLSDAELAQAVDNALARIPETQAAAFRLLKGEGLSVAEAAAVMGTTKGAVKLRAHRAYEALRGMLSAHLPPAGSRRGVGRGEP